MIIKARKNVIFLLTCFIKCAKKCNDIFVRRYIFIFYMSYKLLAIIKYTYFN